MCRENELLFHHKTEMISEKKHSHYNYHRWYNPDIGRYMENDNPQINPILSYIYSDSNPVFSCDLSGEYTISDSCKRFKSQMRDAIDKAKRVIRECSFVSDWDKDEIAYVLEHSHYRCSKFSGYAQCGYSFWFPIAENSLRNIGYVYGNCKTCLEGVLAHEAVHLAGGSHCDALSIEIKCFSCVGEERCREYEQKCGR